jgi:Ser/Thr protein kinase RdoA (MazF antagonist)
VQRRYALSLSNARDLGGSANLNLLASSGDRPFVVRVYRSSVTAERVEALQHARTLLAAGSVPCAEPVLTVDGASLVAAGGNIVEVEPFVDSDAKMDSLDRIASGLPILGRIHQLLSTVDSRRASSSPPDANYVDCVGVVESTRAGTDRIRSWAPTSDERDLADAADRLAGAIAQLHVDFGESPRQLVHGDYWDNNVLFCGGQVVLVGDLDFMGVRPRIDDLALTLYYTMYELDDPLGDDGLRRLVQLVNAYDLGASPRLSTIERAVLPIAIARQSLWSVAIWGAQLDDEETARRHLRGHLREVNRALALIAGLPRVQAALV